MMVLSTHKQSSEAGGPYPHALALHHHQIISGRFDALLS